MNIHKRYKAGCDIEWYDYAINDRQPEAIRLIRDFAELAEKHWARVLNRASVAISSFWVTAAVADTTLPASSGTTFISVVASMSTIGGLIVIIMNLIINAPKAYSRARRIWFCITGNKPNRRVTDIPRDPK